MYIDRMDTYLYKCVVGMQDVGIYRISGLSSEIQRLKKAFEKSR